MNIQGIAMGVGMIALAGLSLWTLRRLAHVETALQDTQAELALTQDEAAIRKLQSLYQHHMLRGDALAIVGLFADSDDVEIELSNKGVMVGRDAPRRYFLRIKPGDPLPEANPQRPPGALVLHTSVNPAIEISPDGMRARALWLSPGITTFPGPDGRPPSPNWNYGKYDMSYVKQDGVWKILTFRWRQIFYSPSDKGWVAVNWDPGPANPDPDRHSEPGFYAPYDPARTNPFDPPPPAPFEGG